MAQYANVWAAARVETERREEATKDGTTFCAKYLPDIKPYAWYSKARSTIEASKFVIIMAPPGSGKTQGITIIEAARRLARDRKHRIGIFSLSKGKAENFMSGVRDILRNNKKLIADFGPFIDKTCEANNSKMRILGASGGESTPSITNLGLSGQAESLRFNTILIDDPINELSAFSEVETKKFIRAMEYTYFERLEPGGQIVIIGSRFNAQDGYRWVLEHSFFKDGVCIIPAMNERDESNVPERWSTEYYRAVRQGLKRGGEDEDVSTAVWNARYMQNPSLSEGHDLNLDWHKWTELNPVNTIVYCDPAYSLATSADYTGMIAIGKHPNGKDYIISGLWHGRLSVGHADLIRGMHNEHHAVKSYVETNNAKTLGNEVRGLGVPCEDVTSTVNKKDISRLGGLELWFKRPPGNGTLFFHESIRANPVLNAHYKAFVQEYVWYPNGAHDHMLDALAGAIAHLDARIDASAYAVCYSGSVRGI